MTPRFFASLVLAAATLLSLPTASAADIYTGEPLGEALNDLARTSMLVSQEFSPGSTALRRTDVFRFPDGRLLTVTSQTPKAGQPFTVTKLQVTPAAAAGQNPKPATVESFELPK
jgi:hypothetical protein